MRQHIRNYNKGIVPGVVLIIICLSIIFMLSESVFANVIEFQIEGDLLSELVGEALLDEGICPLSTSFGPIVDSVNLRTEGFYARLSPEAEDIAINAHDSIMANPAQLVIPLSLGLKGVACVETPGCDDHFHESSTDAYISLSIDGTELCGEFAGFSVTLDPDIGPGIGDTFGRRCLDIGIENFDPFVGNARIIGRGVTVNDDGRLAIRFEYSPVDEYGLPINGVDLGEWSRFFAGEVSPAVDGSDWGVFVDQTLLRESQRIRIDNSFIEATDIFLNGRSSTSWVPTPDGGRIRITTDARYSLWGSELGFTANTEIGLTLGDISLLPPEALPADGVLIADATFDFSPDPALIAGYSFIFTGILGPFVLGDFLATLGTTAGILDSIEPPASDFVDTEDMEGADGIFCSFIGDDRMRCLNRIRLQPMRIDDTGPFGELSITGLEGNEEGLMFSGTFSLGGHVYVERLTADVTPLVLDAYGNCCSEGVRIRGTLSLHGSGHLCGDPLIVSDDDLGVYSIARISDRGAPMGIYMVSLNAEAGHRFWDGPYSVRIQVSSTVGQKVFLMDHPSRISTEEWWNANELCSIERINCIIDRIGRRWDDSRIPPRPEYAITPVKDIGYELDKSTAEISPELSSESVLSRSVTGAVFSGEGSAESKDTSSSGTKDKTQSNTSTSVIINGLSGGVTAGIRAK